MPQCTIQLLRKLASSPTGQEASYLHPRARRFDDDQAALDIRQRYPDIAQIQPVRAGAFGCDQFYQESVFAQNDTFAIRRMAPVLQKSQTYRRQFKNRKAEDVPGAVQGKQDGDCQRNRTQGCINHRQLPGADRAIAFQDPLPASHRCLPAFDGRVKPALCKTSEV